MIILVRILTNFWMKVRPPWTSYFAHSNAAGKLYRAGVYLHENYTQTASYQQRGYLTPDQDQTLTLLGNLSAECHKEARRMMQPITFEELKP